MNIATKIFLLASIAVTACGLFLYFEVNISTPLLSILGVLTFLTLTTKTVKTEKAMRPLIGIETQGRVIIEEPKEELLPSAPKEPYIRLMDTFYPARWLLYHLFVLGRTGCGKTWALIGLLRDLLGSCYEFGVTPPLAIIRDYRGEFMSMFPPGYAFTFDITDLRCVALDLRDFNTKRLIRALAHLIIQKEDSKNPFFHLAARALFIAAMTARIRRGEPFTLKNICADFRNVEMLKKLLKGDPDGEYALRILNRENDDVYLSLMNYIAPLEEIAEIWEGKPLVSLKRFLRGGYPQRALIIGEDHSAPELPRTLNAILMTRIMQLIMSGEKSPELRYVIVFEEYANFPALQLGLTPEEFVSVCRDKGCSVWVSVQSRAGQDAVHKDNPHLSDKLMSEMGTVVFMNNENPTSYWCAQMLGRVKTLHYMKSWGQSWNFHGCTFSENWSPHIMENWCVDPSLFPAVGLGLGYAYSRHFNGVAWFGRVSAVSGEITEEQRQRTPMHLPAPELEITPLTLPAPKDSSPKDSTASSADEAAVKEKLRKAADAAREKKHQRRRQTIAP